LVGFLWIGSQSQIARSLIDDGQRPLDRDARGLWFEISARRQTGYLRRT